MEGNSGGGFPPSHVTTTTSSGQSTIRFDPVYVQSLPGTLKCGQLVLSLLSFICVSVAKRPSSSPVIWFSLVSMSGFFITLILLVLFLYHLIEKLATVPWLIVEWVYCAIWAFFNFTAATAAATQGSYDPSMAAGAFFGYCTLLVYAFDAYLKYISWRAGDVAQPASSRKVNDQQTA